MTNKIPSTCNYLMGIDGGGSNCRARLTDLQGNVLGDGQSGSANVFQNAANAWHSLTEAANTAVNAANLPQDTLLQTYVVAGLAGAEVTPAAEKFLALVSGFYGFELLNDGQIACLGAHQGQDGTVLIIGTGIIGFSLHKEQWHRVGGWGFPLADEGSGAWLGMQAIRAALNQLDTITEESELTQAVWQAFPEGVYQLLSWSQSAKSGDYGKFAPMVVDAFNQNDSVAVSIIEKQIASIQHQLKALHQNNLPLCLMGGLADWIENKLPPPYNQFLRPAKGDALTGALSLAQKRINL